MPSGWASASAARLSLSDVNSYQAGGTAGPTGAMRFWRTMVWCRWNCKPSRPAIRRMRRAGPVAAGAASFALKLHTQIFEVYMQDLQWRTILRVRITHSTARCIGRYSNRWRSGGYAPGK